MIGRDLGKHSDVRSQAMRPLMRKLTRSCTFHFALGVAWLPYILMRCHDNPATHEVTGKYDVTVASTISLAPPVLIATLLAPAASIGWQPTVPLAHGPPSYLLHYALLI